MKEWSYSMPCSSRRGMVSLEVLQAGAVQPFGALPVNLVRTSIDFTKTSRCCWALRIETNSWVYPCRPLCW
jgi:hypothetical protein